MGEAQRNDERTMLLYHGTEAIGLKPKNVVDAARDDIARMNARCTNNEGKDTGGGASLNQKEYAFIVVAIDCFRGEKNGPKRLIESAISHGPIIEWGLDRSHWLNYDNLDKRRLKPDPVPYNTRYLYRHPDLLRAALALL